MGEAKRKKIDLATLPFPAQHPMYTSQGGVTFRSVDAANAEKARTDLIEVYKRDVAADGWVVSPNPTRLVIAERDGKTIAYALLEYVHTASIQGEQQHTYPLTLCSLDGMGGYAHQCFLKIRAQAEQQRIGAIIISEMMHCKTKLVRYCWANKIVINFRHVLTLSRSFDQMMTVCGESGSVVRTALKMVYDRSRAASNPNLNPNWKRSMTDEDLKNVILIAADGSDAAVYLLATVAGVVKEIPGPSQAGAISAINEQARSLQTLRHEIFTAFGNDFGDITTEAASLDMLERADSILESLTNHRFLKNPQIPEFRKMAAMFAKILGNPQVMEMLSKLTPDDVAAALRQAPGT
ncbi:hypothetical protein NP945_16510 [Mesorhizobium sp. LMG17149]|uniref:hypothetical protein n=1 Tax=Mesorhizobium sp. LMG17149 TaxID=2968497 RepID=UPI002118BFBF|nr:hypothetical protein [Mesorhizobium sp. LMG17149]MCQ8873437.1 hypothetical protein [Mesorhizobium sp. LMG17149]